MVSSDQAEIIKRRDAAGQMQIGLEEEGNIVSFFKFGEDRLLIVKQKATYEIFLADRIDPERSNINIPNAQQRMFDRGSDDKTIQSIVLQSKSLLEGGLLKNLDIPIISKIIVECCAEALALWRIVDRVERNQEACLNSVSGKSLADGIIIPTLHDLEQDVKSALNRADHFGGFILKLTRKFIGNIKSFESLLANESKSGEQTRESIQTLEKLVHFLRFVRETRNSMEHPSAHRRINVRNFEIDALGRLVAPTFEHIHQNYGQERVAITTFLVELHKALIEVFVLWISRLAAQKAHADGAPVTVQLIPKDRRTFPHVKFGYALNTPDGLVPLG